MTEILFDNNASALLASGIVPATLVISVDPGDGALFPSPGAGEYSVLAIEDDAGQLEYVHLTSRTTDALTVTRAQEGTAALTFALGSRVELRNTKGVMEWLVQKDAVVNQIRGASVADLPVTWAANQPQISGSDIATISDVPVTTAYTDTFLATGTAAAARAVLGSTSVGDALFITATAITARTTLGIEPPATARALFKLGDQRVFWATAVGGTANAITCTIEETTALQAGDVIFLVPTADNTAAITLNPSAIGVTAIKDTVSGEDLAAGSMLTGELSMLVYNGSVFEYSDGIVISGEQTYSASGNITKPSWADDNTFCFAELLGAGGSGAKAVNAAGNYAGGGAGGAYIRVIIPAAEVDDAAAITIGAGGAAVTVAGDGVLGGDTTIALSSGGTFFGAGGFSGRSDTNRNSTNGIGGRSGETTPSYYLNGNAFAEDGTNGADGSSSTVSGAAAGDGTYAGGGGGGAAEDISPGPTAPGTSTYAGAGGAGGYDAISGTDGNVPAGGGGGCDGPAATSGAGADGKARTKWIRIGRRSTIADGTYLMRRAAI